MKRAFPQKVKPVPSRVSEDTGVDQTRQALPEVTRRVSTSAAMIGLAISVGAPSLLLTTQSDEAMAAEPVGSEPVVAATPATFDATASASDAASASAPVQAFLPSDTGVIEHTVQEGQSIWQLAQMYGVDAVTVAAVNQVSLDTVLRVGQVLKIPAGPSTVSTVTPDRADRSTPGYYGPITVDTATHTSSSNDLLVDQDTALKGEQDAAVERLRQKQDSLRLGLAKLKTVNRNIAPSKFAQPEDQPIEPEVQTGSTYRVAPGDTLNAIARAHGIALSELAKANRISDPNFIFVNQTLTIPQRSTSAPQDGSAVASTSVMPNLVAMSSTTEPLSVPVITADTEVEQNAVPTVTPFNQSSKSAFKAQIASVPATAQTSAEAVSGAISGQTETVQVAVAPYATGSPTTEGTPEVGAQTNYVESLKQEILKLREKYKSSGTQLSTRVQSETRVAAVSLVNESPIKADVDSTRINPEFNPAGHTASLRSQVRQLQNRAQLKQAASRSGTTAASESRESSQLVATASIGAGAYEPLLPSSLGRTVSPNLPPLGAVENYLPGTSGRFNGYIWPTRGVLTSGYGWRWGRMHKGIDIAAPIGTPIVAAAPGVVITAGWNSGGYGNLVEVQHPDGSVTLYAHNDRILVREGQQVEQGQQIAEMGSTGYSTGPHCHFEVHLPGHGAVNPMAHLPRGA